METTQKSDSVCVTRCEKCSREQYGFREVAGPCVRCGNGWLNNRWISKPTQNIYDRAVRDSGAAKDE